MEQKQHQKSRWFWLAVILAGGVLLLVVLVLVYYNAKLNLIQYDNTQSGGLAATGNNAVSSNSSVSSKSGAGVSTGGAVSSTGETQPTQESNVTNVLLLGTCEWGPLSDDTDADTLMILSVNTKLHTVKLASIQYHVEVTDMHGQSKEISETFVPDGAKGILQIVNTQFDLPIDCFMRVNYSTFSEGIDVLGGVDIVLEEREAKALNGEIFSNAITRHKVQAGLNHLDGYDALQYCRLIYPDCDRDRNQRQRAVIQAAIDKAQKQDLFTLDELANTVLPLVQTNMSKQEITTFLLEVPIFIGSGATVQQFSLPVKDTYTEIIRPDGKIVISMDFKENADALHDYLYGTKAAS